MKNKKTYLRLAAVLIFVYLAMSFVNLNLNALQWSKIDRSFVVLFYSVLFPLIILFKDEL